MKKKTPVSEHVLQSRRPQNPASLLEALLDNAIVERKSKAGFIRPPVKKA